MQIPVKVRFKKLFSVRWRLKMPDFLVFQVYGNLASWGDVAVGEHRPTQSYPTKSAMCGLIAASLGLKRENDEPHKQLNDHYGVAVCVQSQGELLRDYHTTQVPAGNENWFTRKDELSFDPQELKTILSQRDYQMDAFYLVAIWQKKLKDTAPYSLEDIAQALKKPVFVTSLGRKACSPSLPYNPQLIKQTSLKNACETYTLPDELIKYQLKKEALITWYWEDLTAEESGMQHTMVYPRRDQVRSRKRWQFLKRKEYYFAEQRQTGNKSGRP